MIESRTTPTVPEAGMAHFAATMWGDARINP